MRLWNYINPEIREKLCSKCKDYGIDCLSDDEKTAVQVKYRNNYYINFTELSTFYTASQIMACPNKILATNHLAKLSKDIFINIRNFKYSIGNYR